MKRLLLLLTMACGLEAEAQETLVINELMQSNIDYIMDDLNDFPDSWVELYNPTDAAVNLHDYQLGTKDDAGKAWQLPDRQVAAHGYVVVYCDKVGSGLHTDYRLESGKGCNVYLMKGGTTCDKVVNLKKQPAPNIAYGRKTDGAEEWGYQVVATPGAANNGQLSSALLGAPVFSQQGRVFTAGKSFQLTLSLPTGSPEGTEIRYTLDGKEPTRTSYRYTTPLTLNNSTVVRAKLFCDGFLSPRSTCHSYLFFPNSRALTLPVVSIITDNRYLNDAKIGIYVDGSYQSGKKNYEFDWRRPVNVEYFEQGDEDSRLNQLCEMRIAGGATRGNKMKSLAVYAHKRFGTKRLAYEFFPDQRPGVTDYKSIMLRNAGNDFDYLYMRDAIIQRTMASRVDLDWQAWRPAIVYINGEYKGMLNIRERSNEDNIYTNYEGLEDIDMFENWGELKEGDWDNYNAFKAFYAEHGHTLAEYSEWMDWEEFLNLMVMNLYFNNQDFPGNNIVMWRPKAEGGRWRWIAKDTDFGLGLYGSSHDYNTLQWLYNPNYDAGRNWANQYEHTRLFRRLMEDADFKRAFIDRTCIYMGDFLNEKGTREVWDPMYERIRTEYPYHRKLINMYWPNYQQELSAARNWLKYRTSAFYKQLGNQYGLGSPVPMTIAKGMESELEELTVNGVSLSKPSFDGSFFANRSLTVSGKAREGKEIVGWQVTTVTTNTLQGSVLQLTMPSASGVTIVPVLADATGIVTLETETEGTLSPDSPLSPASGQAPGLYDLQGRPVSHPHKGGIYIVKAQNGRKIIKMKDSPVGR